LKLIILFISFIKEPITKPMAGHKAPITKDWYILFSFINVKVIIDKITTKNTKRISMPCFL
jgi:hypothetical protein